MCVRHERIRRTYRGYDGGTDGHVGDLEILHAIYVQARIDDSAFIPRLHGAGAELVSIKSEHFSLLRTVCSPNPMM